MEIPDHFLILDDWKGRNLAQHLDLNYTGTLGIFILAKKLKLIDSVSVYIEKIKMTNFHCSKKLLDDVLKKAGEN